VWTGNWSIENSPSYLWYDAVSRVVSPYVANIFDLNPLRDVVEREIDFERIRKNGAMKVFVSATNVHTGRPHVFETGKLSADAVMASACLPDLFKAVEIGGIPYWDGGYGGNPALSPFFRETQAQDLLLVQINPIERAETPMAAREIQNRVDEITFNAALLRELKSIAFVNELIAAGRMEGTPYRTIRMHRIDADEALRGLSASSKINAEPEFLQYLRELGRACADDWLEDSGKLVGHEATLDLSGEIDIDLGAVRKPLGSRVRDFMTKHAMPHRRAG
jgi:NTE family protein